MTVPSWFPIVLVVVVLVFLEWRRRSKSTASPRTPAFDRPQKVVEIQSESDQPSGFGRKNKWVAVRSSDAGSVAQALGLASLQPCNWHSGVLAAYAYPSDYVFVTPPLNGWVLAVGMGLPDPADPGVLPRWRALMAKLSERFGDAQFFASHRGSSYSAWAKYSDGQETRLFAYADDPIYDLGNRQPEEHNILANLPDPAAAEADPTYWERENLRTPGEEDVFQLAAAWSFDPSTLDERALPPSVGVIGRAQSIGP